MVVDSSSLLDLVDTPYIQTHAVEERNAGYNRERPGGGKGHGITEIEEGGGYRAKDD